MNKKIIFFILSPYRAKDYDFDNLLMPIDEELLILTDSLTVEKFLINKKFQVREVPMVDYHGYGFQFLSIGNLREVILEYLQKGNYDVILHADEELFLDDVALFNDEFYLQGLGVEEMKKFRDKFVMKEVLKKTPEHFLLPRHTNSPVIAKEFIFPIIKKPLLMAGSLGVVKINNPLELSQQAISGDTVGNIYEEFIEGDLYHCDALVYEGRLYFFLAAKYFYPLEYATANLPYMGSEIFEEGSIYLKLKLATESVVDILNTPNSIVHLEFIVKEGDIFFVEIGKRPGGPWICSMYNIAYGINTYNLHLYSSYANNFFIEKVENIFIKKYKYCCGINHLITKSGTLLDVTFPKDVPCGNVNRVFSKKINTYQSKTNSMLDGVAESILYSNDFDAYSVALNLILKRTKIILAE